MMLADIDHHVLERSVSPEKRRRLRLAMRTWTAGFGSIVLNDVNEKHFPSQREVRFS